MKFRKKPVVVDAHKWDQNEDCLCVPDWLVEEVLSRKESLNKTTGELYIRTLEGEMTAQPGDYIIRGVKGELYPCKPDIFEQTYEAVESKA